jgi:tetratricopeptide (TPR) repeat protein
MGEPHEPSSGQPAEDGADVPSDPTQTLDVGPPPDAADPDRIGRFQIAGRLGRGAMGVVYQARDTTTGATVALKTMYRLGPERVYRFKREFRSLTGVRHRNVVALHELFGDKDQLYFTMELVTGVEIVRALCGPPAGGRRHEPCRDYDRLRNVFGQLADGIAAIHRAGILHRDIKPSNVLVTSDDRVVLLDFGLVREHGGEQMGVTADGALLGTPMYMAPEQALGVEVGPATDWYAFGELLYHALVGEPPFASLALLAMLAAKRDTSPPRPSAVLADIPDDLDALCAALLVPDPKQRPTGEQILGQLLRHVSGQMPGRMPGQASGRISGHTSDAGPSRAKPASEPVAELGEVFFGRADELAALADAWTTARRRPVLVLVEGPSGIGKSALAEHFCETVARQDDAMVLVGHCSERESIPFKALDAAIDGLALRLGVHRDPRQVEALLPRDVRSLARLFPVLRSVPAIALAAGIRDDEELEPVIVRRRAIAALGEMLGRIADRRRLVLRIEDFQWADHDSAVLLGGVLRQADPPSMLVVLTVRDGASRDGTPLVRLLTELAERDEPLTVRRLPLGPLAPEEVEQLAIELLGARGRKSKSLVRDIVREADGSPFFVGELVRYAQLLDSADGLPVDEAAVRLENVIRSRIARLPESVLRVLEVAAVAGGRTSCRIALAVGGAGVDPSSIRALADDRLVRLHGPGLDDAVEIDHDRIRATVLEGIDAAALSRLHLAIAQALGDAGVADEPALAHHYRAAGELRLAHDHTLLAARQAAEALAFDRAAELYRVALSLDVLAPEEYADVHAQMADALANAGRIPEAARAYRRAAESGGPMAIEWRRRAAEHLLASGHTDDGRVALEQVLRDVGLSLPSSTVRAVGSLVFDRMRLSMGGLEANTGTVVAPKETLERLDVCWTASRGLIYTDGLAGAAFHAQHLRLALKCGEPVRVARALAVEAHLTVALGADPKLAGSLALIERAQKIADAADSHYARGMVAECAGHVAIAVGDWATCFERLEQAIAIFRDHCTGVAHEIGICRAHGALCLQFMGRVPQLRERAYELLEDTRDRPNPYVTGFARGILGNMALLAPDRVEEAAEQLAIYKHDAPRRYQGHMVNYVCQTAALERYRERPDRAYAMGVSELPVIAKLPVRRSPQVDAEVLLYTAQNALAGAAVVNDPKPRLAEANRAIAGLLGHVSAYARAYGKLCRASADALLGRKDAAIEGLRAAIAGFSATKMLAFEASCERRLAALLEGEAAREAASRSDAAMTQMGVLRPDRFTAMMAPGFTRD